MKEKFTLFVSELVDVALLILLITVQASKQ